MTHSVRERGDQWGRVYTMLSLCHRRSPNMRCKHNMVALPPDSHDHKWKRNVTRRFEYRHINTTLRFSDTQYSHKCFTVVRCHGELERNLINKTKKKKKTGWYFKRFRHAQLYHFPNYKRICRCFRGCWFRPTLISSSSVVCTTTAKQLSGQFKLADMWYLSRDITLIAILRHPAWLLYSCRVTNVWFWAHFNTWTYFFSVGLVASLASIAANVSCGWLTWQVRSSSLITSDLFLWSRISVWKTPVNSNVKCLANWPAQQHQWQTPWTLT